MIASVIFDLFGTLIHLPRDTKPYLQLCRAISDSSRLRESLVVEAPTLADFCDHLGVSHPPNLSDIQRDLGADIDLAETFPESLAALQTLRERGLRVALISNLASPYKRAVVRLDLESYFDTILYSCDIGIAKPDLDIYRDALTKLNATAESTLMVGDSQPDVGAARNAGMPVVAVSYGYRKVPAEHLGADALIDHFGELPAALNGLLNGVA